jgi:hypothetical protein
VELVNNCITTHNKDECIEVIDSGGLHKSRYARQLMPGGILTDNCKTLAMTKPVEEPMENAAAKPATKLEQNKEIPATLQ